MDVFHSRYLMCLLALVGMGCSDSESGGRSPAPDAGAPDGALADVAPADVFVEADGPAPDAALDPTLEVPYSATLDLPEEPANYANPEIPEHFRVETLRFHGQAPVMDEDTTPPDNPTTDLGATLGRVLFYDTNLSLNRTVACASCHQPQFGFSDDRVKSKGLFGEDTARHSMGLTNARFYRQGSYFWDQRAATLEEQALMPFQDQVEMGMTLDGLVERVENGDYYPALFEAAFGDPEVTPDRIAKALAQFVRGLISTGSKYDQGRAMVASRGVDFPNFTEDENRGKRRFVLPPPQGGFGCFVCHQGEAFIAQTATNNGLDADSADDLGLGGVTDNPAHDGQFKVPSLRNVELRAPYMHDGRFATLEEVINHYSEGIQPHPNLGPPFFAQGGQVAQINMSIEDKRSLRAFLRTLTDLDMVNDPKFGDPFIRD